MQVFCVMLHSIKTVPKGVLCGKNMSYQKILWFVWGRNMNCKFCDRLTETFGKFCVCRECKTVCFAENIPSEEANRLISEYLERVQSEITIQQTYLHNIEQKYISNKELQQSYHK